MQTRSDASPVIVTGMHRSGTSFVASLLRQAGVDLGTRLMPAGKGNERGHYENLDFVEFHERWLRLSGYEEAGWVVANALALPDDARAEALDLVASNRRPHAWGWKDPRTTLFLDFWADLAPNGRYVLLYREPSEVVDSLFRRGDAATVAAPDLGARAWLCHSGIALRFARANRSRCVLANVAVIAREPQRFLRAVSSRFDLPLDEQITSPFEADLMVTLETGTVKPTLLRHLMPEAERLFLELEAEADFAAGVHRDGPVTSRRARETFFRGWAATHELQSSASADGAAYDSVGEKTREQVFLTTEVVTAVSKIREDIEQYKAALSLLSEVVEAGENVEQ